MTTQNEVPGIQPSLLEEATKMRALNLEEADRQLKEKQSLESERLEQSKEAFLEYLDKYAGTVLRQLTQSPVVENLAGNWLYRFNVAHVIIELATPESLHGGCCHVGVSTEGGYFGDSRKREWIDTEKLSNCLLNLVGQIAEQYQKYHLLAAELKQYNDSLRIAEQKTENDIARDRAGVWSWPELAAISLYKITWTKGAFYDSNTGEACFQYESGWALSDSPDEVGYFHLLTPRNYANPTIGTSSRKLKITPNSIELYCVSRSADVPRELMETVYCECEVAVAKAVSIREAEWDDSQASDYKVGLKEADLDDLEGTDGIHIVFLEYLPMSPPRMPDLVVIKSKSVDLGRVPCLELRLAASAASCK
ncbi:MAG: hypothetical protein HC786_21410 [Richelia sp. CSU_2_1]|nr:hypothetical protein [Microcoleus sp. SU_5_3]NJR24529.1 hypothetical protein [Richelia sp. CSU_2_1]